MKVKELKSIKNLKGRVFWYLAEESYNQPIKVKVLFYYTALAGFLLEIQGTTVVEFHRYCTSRELYKTEEEAKVVARNRLKKQIKKLSEYLCTKLG